MIAAVESKGLSRREAGRHNRIGEATAVRWLCAVRQGRCGPRAQGGVRRSRRSGLAAAAVKMKPDLTPLVVVERFLAETGAKADVGMLSWFLTGGGISFRKSVHATEQLRPDEPARREGWHVMQAVVAVGCLIFLDETGVTTNMLPCYGCEPRSRRVCGFAPAGHGKIATFLAGLVSGGIVAPVIVDAPMSRAKLHQSVPPYLV